MEHNLDSLFELAARWKAVLLFDEADVFLESRSGRMSDLTRNALVSVLLRVLEYYSGILILTTNRINQFDIAVMSRVNLGIQYSDLKTTQKQTIFKELVERVDKDLIEEREEIIDWVQDTCGEEGRNHRFFKPLNGRQIRNVLFSAASLSARDGGKLKLRHIEDMLYSTSDFQTSLQSEMERQRIRSEPQHDMPWR